MSILTIVVDIGSRYRASFIDKGFERSDIIATICTMHPVTKCLYPGCNLHVTPSFHIRECVYIDNDRSVAKIFSDSASVTDFIRNNKKYPDEPIVRFYGSGYHSPVSEEPSSFDLLISQYAGFVSEYYIDYLKPGGILWVNNSHGDASRASLDPSYEPVGVFLYGGKYVGTNIGAYFVPQTPELHTIPTIKRTKQGSVFTRPSASYLFRKK